MAGAVYFVRVRRVDAERFVASARNREVVSCGRGECRCHIGIGLESRNCLAGLRDVCVCSDGCFRLTFGGCLVRNACFADFGM